MSLKALREKNKELCEESAAIYALADEEKRELSEADRSRLDAIGASLDQVSADISRAEKIADYQARLAVKSAPLPAERKVDSFAEIMVPANQRRVRKLAGFKSERDAYAAGQWLLATLYGNHSAKEWCDSHGVEIQSAMSTGVGEKGGFTVPSFLDQAIIDLRESRGVFRQNANVTSMPSDTHSIARRTGGLTAYFVGENDETTASDKAFDQVKLVARKMAALCKYSSEIAEDSIVNVANDIASEIAYAFADKEDSCGFNGDGTSTYGGIVGVKNAVAAGSEYTAITGNTAFSTLDRDDYEAMIGKLPLYALQNAKWFISRAGWAASMLRLANAAGGNTSREIEGGVMPMFMGFPVVWTQVMNSTLTAQTSTEGLAYFGDLSQAAVLGDRRVISIKATADRYFELDQIGIIGTQRIDINVHERGTASVAGSIISLLTPGS